MKTRTLFRTLFIAALSTPLPAQYVCAQTSPNSPAPSAPAAPATATSPAVAAPVYREGVVKVGSELKQSRGRITDVDKGDNGCYLTMRDEKKNELIEVGTFALCSQKPPFKGKQVQLTYSMETIQAGDCYGDPKCKRTETVPVITAVSIIE